MLKLRESGSLLVMLRYSQPSLELAPDNIRVITMYPDYTASDFSKNALTFGPRPVSGSPTGQGEPLKGDSPEKVAQKILEAASDELAEKYME